MGSPEARQAARERANRPPLLTPSPLLAQGPAWPATGNEWVSLPAIDPSTGGVRTVEVLSMRALGSLGLAASPDPWGAWGNTSQPSLIQPFFEVEGHRQHLADASPQVHWLEEWVVQLTWELGRARMTALIWAPVGQRGFVYRLTLTNAAGSPLKAAFGLDGRWESLLFTLFRSRSTGASLCCHRDAWTGSLALEATAGWPLVAWAVGMDEPAGVLECTEPGQAPVRFTVGRSVTLPPGGEATATFYVSVAPEMDGARTTGVDLRRRGWRSLLDETLAWLGARRRELGCPELERLVNRNLFFNYFFSCGRTIDTEEWVAVTSRSPRYYVSGAFWARDSLSWSLPGLLLVEPATARQVLLFAFRYGWKNPGVHAQYVNGTTLYPGFELDELAAYPVALGRYLEATRDETILHEPEVARALRGFPSVLRELGGDGPLYATFLDPSDDPPPFPYLTYDNALLWRGLVDLGKIYEKLGWDELSAWAGGTAERLRSAILSTCVVEGPLGPMFAWAVDGRGAFVLYDNPPGSLQLLGMLGLCDRNHPAWVNTIRWVHSPSNRHWYPGEFGDAGSAHAPRPWPMAAANTLLAAPAGSDLHARALDLLRKAPLDGGIVCETVDPHSGAAASGAAFASAAGYVAWAVLEAMRRAAG